MRAVIIIIRPLANITHLRIFLDPLSLDTLNKSRSEEPTSAPENEFDEGAMIKDTIIRIAANANKIQIKIVMKTSFKSIITFSIEKTKYNN